MKQLKCESCGAQLKVDEKSEYAVCEYCGTKVKLDSNPLKNHFEALNTVSQTFSKRIIFVFISFFVIVFIGIMMHSLFFNFSSHSNKSEHSDVFDDFEKRAFNSKFESYSGTSSEVFAKLLLDKVVTNNKTQKNHLIEISIGSVVTNKPDEIIKLKKTLEDREYEIILDYDDEGLVYKITIE